MLHTDRLQYIGFDGVQMFRAVELGRPKIEVLVRISPTSTSKQGFEACVERHGMDNPHTEESESESGTRENEVWKGAPAGTCRGRVALFYMS